MAENRALIPDPLAMYTQTDLMKDVKDLSKNLVSEDFERQYKNGMVEKARRRRPTVTILAVALGAVAVWVLAITVVREVQIARLRHEVDELTANVIALSANVKALNQKIGDNGVFNEIKELEDTAEVAEGINNISKTDLFEISTKICS